MGRRRHRARLLAIIRQMLVAKDGHTSAGLVKDFDDLLEKLKAGIELLPLLVKRIIAVFADEQDAVHRELVAAKRQRAANVRVEREAVLASVFLTQVARAGLRDVHASDAVIGIVHLAVAEIAVEEPAAEVVGVRQIVIGRGDDGEFFRRLVGPRRRLAARMFLGLESVRQAKTGGRAQESRDVRRRRSRN